MFKLGFASSLMSVTYAWNFGYSGFGHGKGSISPLAALDDVDDISSGLSRLGHIGGMKGINLGGKGYYNSRHGLSGLDGSRDLGHGYGDHDGYGYGELDDIGDLGYGVDRNRLGVGFIRRGHRHHSGRKGLRGLNGLGSIGGLGSIEYGVKKDSKEGPLINTYGDVKYYKGHYGDGGVHNGGHTITGV